LFPLAAGLLWLLTLHPEPRFVAIYHHETEKREQLNMFEFYLNLPHIKAQNENVCVCVRERERARVEALDLIYLS